MRFFDLEGEPNTHEVAYSLGDRGEAGRRGVEHAAVDFGCVESGKTSGDGERMPTLTTTTRVCLGKGSWSAPAFDCSRFEVVRESERVGEEAAREVSTRRSESGKGKARKKKQQFEGEVTTKGERRRKKTLFTRSLLLSLGQRCSIASTPFHSSVFIPLLRSLAISSLSVPPTAMASCGRKKEVRQSQASTYREKTTERNNRN